MSESKTQYKLITYLAFSRIFIFLLPLIFKMVLLENEYANFGSFIFSNLSGWDAHHYLYLAENWYASVGDEANYIVFPPLYPFLIKIITLVTNNYLASALLISNFAFIAAGVVFYKLLRIDHGKKFSVNTVFLLSIFPTAYFFSLAYTESLFLLLVLLTMYFARKDKWLFAGVFTALALLTRHLGIILVPVVLFEWYRANPKRSIRSLIEILLPPSLSVFLYLLINKATLGNYLAFSSVLKTHWHKSFSLPWGGIGNAINVAKGSFGSHSFMIGVVEAVFAITAWILAIVGFKKIRTSYAIYTILGTLIFTSTGFLLSTPRYFLSIPTLFIIINTILNKNEEIRNLWIVISIMLLSYFTLLYAMGGWAF